MHPNGDVSQTLPFLYLQTPSSYILIKNKIYENHIYKNKIGRLKTILTTTRVS